MNRLDHIDEFEEILKSYIVSDESRAILASTRLVLMVAPSASGRNTIINELLKTEDYYFIISDTTRKPRVNNAIPEQDGVEYWFRQEDELLEDLRQGKFLEAEIIHGQQVSGISIRELAKARDAGKVAVTDIELAGIHNVIALKPDTIALMVIPPSFKVWQERLSNRGEMDLREHRRRLETAVRILKDGLSHDYFTFVVNDEFHHSVQKIQAIVHTGRNEVDQLEAKGVIERLVTATEDWLESN